MDPTIPLKIRRIILSLKRVSIFQRIILQGNCGSVPMPSKMDARVKPAHDGLIFFGRLNGHDMPTLRPAR